MAHLYKLTFASGKIYIGITTKGAEHRYKAHKYDAYNMSAYSMRLPIYNAWRKYGDPTLEVLEEGDIEYIKRREFELIIELNCKAPNGYNVNDGGDASPMWNKAIAAEVGKKVSAAWNDPINRLRWTEQRKGRITSEETKGKISDALKDIPKPPGFGYVAWATKYKNGYEVSDNAKNNMSMAAKERADRPGERERLSAIRALGNGNGRRCMVDGKEFNSVKEAIASTGISYNSKVGGRKLVAIITQDGKATIERIGKEFTFELM
jgi:group I intron endonuclease